MTLLNENSVVNDRCVHVCCWKIRIRYSISNIFSLSYHYPNHRTLPRHYSSHWSSPEHLLHRLYLSIPDDKSPTLVLRHPLLHLAHEFTLFNSLGDRPIWRDKHHLELLAVPQNLRLLKNSAFWMHSIIIGSSLNLLNQDIKRTGFHHKQNHSPLSIFARRKTVFSVRH